MTIPFKPALSQTPDFKTARNVAPKVMRRLGQKSLLV